MNKTQLLKNICAICNSGGGVIIIGAQRKNEFLYANGIKFET
jgi:predicted HTH transcriptional regulator